MQKSVPEIVKAALQICYFPQKNADELQILQLCNSSKVTDHHAIIPTIAVAAADVSALPKGEREILMLVAKRLVASVSESYRYAETIVTLDSGGAA